MHIRVIWVGFDRFALILIDCYVISFLKLLKNMIKFHLCSLILNGFHVMLMNLLDFGNIGNRTSKTNKMNKIGLRLYYIYIYIYIYDIRV